MTDMSIFSVINDDLWADIANNLTQPGNDGCRHWQGQHNNNHPVINVRGRLYRVAPMLLQAKLGRPIADGMNTLHTCNDHRCLAFAHLYEAAKRGTVATPARSTYMTNGSGPRVSPVARSIHNRPSKLTETDVRLIRVSPLSAAELARQLGVGKMTIYNARVGKTWKHVERSTEG